MIPGHDFPSLVLQVSLDESDEQDGTPLHYAAKKGFVGLAKVLVGAGATVDVRNAKNMAPLHLVRQGRVGLVGDRLSYKTMPQAQPQDLLGVVYVVYLQNTVCVDLIIFFAFVRLANQ